MIEPTVAAEPTVAVTRSRKGRFRRVRKLGALLKSNAHRRALIRGVAATVEHSNVQFSSPLRSVIDVGAHRGQFAVFIKSRFPSALLYCVEPLEQPQATLRKALASETGVVVLDSAAAESKGPREFHVSRESDSSSLRQILSTYTTAFPGTEEKGVVSVQAAPLDELLAGRPLPRPCLLKIDVQGTELEVLRGSTQVLEEVDDIFVECSFVEFYKEQALADQVIDYLHQCNFRLAGVYSVVHDGEGHTLQADLLFKRAER